MWRTSSWIWFYFKQCIEYAEKKAEGTKFKKSIWWKSIGSKIKTYNKYRLLIIGEIVYLPIDQLGANLFLRLITKRYEHTRKISRLVKH